MTTTISPSLGAAPLFTQQGTGASPGYAAVDLRRHISAASLQEGVYAATDFEVVQRAAGANLSVDIGGAMAAGGSFALVQGDTVNGQGLYVVAAHSATINEAIAAADATNPRVDQVILEIQDNVHDASGGNLARVRVLTGTPTVGATLDNRTGAAALPGSALLLADVHVPALDTTIANTQIRDRRKWARGAYSRLVRTAGNYTTASAALVEIDATNLKPRIECSGAPLRVLMSGVVSNNTNATNCNLGLFLDGAGIDTTGGLEIVTVPTAGYNQPVALRYEAVPAAGSHRFSPTFSTNGGTLTLNGTSSNPLIVTIEEVVRQNTANNATTSG